MEKSATNPMNKATLYRRILAEMTLYPKSLDGTKFCINLILRNIEVDKETVLLASVDSTLEREDIELYESLVYDFGVKPDTFSLRYDILDLSMKKDSIKVFMRQIKLKGILND
jgi:hypothetical protein